jgi:hypothetical protein
LGSDGEAIFLLLGEKNGTAEVTGRERGLLHAGLPRNRDRLSTTFTKAVRGDGGQRDTAAVRGVVCDVIEVIQDFGRNVELESNSEGAKFTAAETVAITATPKFFR